MAQFILCINAGECFPIEAATPREAARMARRMGKDLMKYNNESSLYWIWDAEAENCLYYVQTVKVGNRIVSVIRNCKKI